MKWANIIILFVSVAYGKDAKFSGRVMDPSEFTTSKEFRERTAKKINGVAEVPSSIQGCTPGENSFSNIQVLSNTDMTPGTHPNIPNVAGEYSPSKLRAAGRTVSGLAVDLQQQAVQGARAADQAIAYQSRASTSPNLTPSQCDSIIKTAQQSQDDRTTSLQKFNEAYVKVRVAIDRQAKRLNDSLSIALMKFNSYVGMGNTLAGSPEAITGAKKRQKQAEKQIKEVANITGKQNIPKDDAVLPNFDEATTAKISKMSSNELLQFKVAVTAYANAYFAGYTSATNAAIKEYNQCAIEASKRKTAFFPSVMDWFFPPAMASGNTPKLMPVLQNYWTQESPIIEPEFKYGKIDVTPVLESIRYLERVKNNGSKRLSDLRNARYDTLKNIYALYGIGSDEPSDSATAKRSPASDEGSRYASQRMVSMDELIRKEKELQSVVPQVLEQYRDLLVNIYNYEMARQYFQLTLK